ncbi:MAG TPA: hypothetical protein ENJ82_15475 [Bacteroidetes bacterium]|nr:hypothetical protein [Bacteroidota bacterium]
MLFLLITRLFLTEKQVQKRKYALQFKLTTLILIGILIAFSLQGYGFYSILFSSLFQLLNYWFIYSFFRDSKQAPDPKHVVAIRFVKTGLWLAILSTLAPWGVGILSAKGLNGTEAYHSFIYFFLHFQYNGWFLFVALGLCFKVLEKDAIIYNQQHALRFYWLFTIAVIPALALSYLGMSFRAYILVPAYLGATLQLVGAAFFGLMLKPLLSSWFRNKNLWFQVFFTAFLASFFLKITLQFISVFPVFEQYVFGNKNIILAYLHLNFIGLLSFLLLALLINLKWLRLNLISKIGSALLVLGFIVTELILMLGGMAIFYDHKVLFLGSLAMSIGILMLVLSPLKPRQANGKL